MIIVFVLYADKPILVLAYSNLLTKGQTLKVLAYLFRSSVVRRVLLCVFEWSTYFLI